MEDAQSYIAKAITVGVLEHVYACVAASIHEADGNKDACFTCVSKDELDVATFNLLRFGESVRGAYVNIQDMFDDTEIGMNTRPGLYKPRTLLPGPQYFSEKISKLVRMHERLGHP